MERKSWDELLSPIQDAGVSEAIVRRLGELLGAGIVGPGDRLPSETEMAAAFAVAPMTVRNALQALRDSGFVETRRGRHAGTYVRDDVAEAISRDADVRPTAEEFADFTVWREAVSGEASARAAQRITDAQKDTLRALAADVDRPGRTVEDYRFADARLHLFIAAVADSPRLEDEERRIQAQLTRTLRHISAPPDLHRFPAQAHGDLVAAIVANDATAARARFAEHVRATRDLSIGFNYLRTEAIRVVRP